MERLEQERKIQELEELRRKVKLELSERAIQSGQAVCNLVTLARDSNCSKA